MKIKIHPAAIVLTAFFIWDKSFGKLLLSVILHECGHSLAAFIIGKRNQVFTLTPMGCSLYVGEIEGKLRSLFVYLAGPLVSLLLIPLLSPQTLWIFTFNAIPLLPLDGGRIISAFLGERKANLLGGMALLFGVELCFLHEINPLGIIVILILHSRYITSSQYTKIRRAADFLRDLY
ncbi:MAG: M50 family metallopeptidase [Clostridia bacterium]